MNRLGYLAANVTDREIAMGVDEFQKLAAAASFPLISANIIYQDDGSSVFPATAERTLPPQSWRGDKPLKLGIVGLTRENPAFLRRTEDGRKVVVASPVQAAAGVVPQLRERSDVVILLARMGTRELNRVLAQVPGIDIVLAGNAGLVYDNRATPPTAATMYAGDQGKRLGEARLFFNNDGLVQVTGYDLYLDRRYPSDAPTKAFEDQANVRINDYYRERAEEQPRVAAVDVPVGPRYVGSAECGVCHEEAFQVWQSGGHAHAIETLIDRQQEFSPLCIGCHVTGNERPSGFFNMKATPEMADVQCEACHGPAAAHLEDPMRRYGDTDGGDCLTCHTHENSPDFDFSSYWEQISH